MKLTQNTVRCLTAALITFGSLVGGANGAVLPTLEGMNLSTSWVDLESTAGELPVSPFGTSDIDGADRIGIYVEFDNGLTGSATYSGVSGVWNTSNFAGISADTATGFFTSAGDLHFLHNQGASLPLAWVGFSMAYSNNFDLDFNENNGSNFRASTTGWTSATFATYSSTAIPEPSSALLFGLGALAIAVRRKRTA